MNADANNPPPLVAVIDDEEDITAFLALALADAGYRVATCNHAGDALAQLRRERPDLICLDLVMPERTGGSLYVALRRDRELYSVPILILSGIGAREETLRRIVATNAVAPPEGCVDKPLDADDLLRRIRALVPVPTGTVADGTGDDPERGASGTPADTGS